ncbi:MAG: bifunctional phosphopantothenoylcysteine decarboxylase/phosphopantothenate--cysteine ligase CoaBC [Nitrospirae bacterium]|nr:MAG: bifunctional phosphopantothenoylcysteine decarboxylase/phosphopantothenate--cysteine ligase CoaBC [Nitrospirota bacterium]
MLKGKSILLGVTGSVAAYKTIELIRLIKKEEASVRVIMTEASQRFMTPLSAEIASGDHVYRDMFDPPLSHISLPATADLLVVAPATANIIGKYANGIADDMLSTAMMAFQGKVIIAPAMNRRMYESPQVQKNLRYLESLGVTFAGPDKGVLACGEEGIGRMAGIDSIMDKIRSALTEQDLEGEQILVTAGPTREYIDPIRYVSNRSSGKMGYAIAAVAKRRGAEVTLITGPSALTPPEGVEVIKVETAAEMHQAVMDNFPMSTIFVMSAAVSDFSPVKTECAKIEKPDNFTLHLRKTSDILEEAGRLKKRPYTVGFSAETGFRLDRAKKKLTAKNMDMMVFNDVTKEGSGFDKDTNEVVILNRDKSGNIVEMPLPLMSKENVAAMIFDRISMQRERPDNE